jgi:hypothetical protein
LIGEWHSTWRIELLLVETISLQRMCPYIHVHIMMYVIDAVNPVTGLGLGWSEVVFFVWISRFYAYCSRFDNAFMFIHFLGCYMTYLRSSRGVTGEDVVRISILTKSLSTFNTPPHIHTSHDNRFQSFALTTILSSAL